jgi:GNAT superfamily N-acetyltransferase
MKPIDYLHLQMELEGVKTNNDNLITRVSSDIDEFPLVLFACTSDKQKLIYFDNLLPLALCNKLKKDRLQSFQIDAAVEVFDLFGISTKSGHSKTYIFPDDFADTDVGNVKCFSQDDSKVVIFGFNGLADRVYAIEHEGTILSACVSSRQNSKSAEAWVFTHPDYRRKGLAQQVVTAWAGSLQRDGIIPFYSHEVENINSANLASKLKLIHVFDETVIEKAA